MDQVVRDCPRADQLEHLVSALGRGIILVDAQGKIIWIDEKTRRQLNGGLRNLNLPVPRTDAPSIDCFVSSVEVTINGELAPICVVQEICEQKSDGADFVAAVEAIMADTSWFTRGLIDKLKAWRQSAHPAIKASDLDVLTDREREILGLICEGRSDEEMSRMLNLSRNTVRNHVASLYRKIGVNRRSTAIIWARERALTSHEVLASQRRAHFRRGRGIA